MANKIIERIFKQRLTDDFVGDPGDLFKKDGWKSQPLSLYYGSSPDAVILVTGKVLATMSDFCSETNRVLDDDGKDFLKEKITPATIVFKKNDLSTAIELMSTTANLHTTPRVVNL
jgi:hypothetical protein